VALCYLRKEEKDAQLTKKLVESKGCQCLLLPGDLRNENHCKLVVEKAYKYFRQLDILVNNAGIHYRKTALVKSVQNKSGKHLRSIFSPCFF